MEINLDKFLSMFFLMLAMLLGFFMGSCSEFNRHKEQMKTLEALSANPAVSMPLEQRHRLNRGK